MKFPIIVTKPVAVTIIDIALTEGEQELTPELIDEIKDWAFYKSQAWGEKAGYLTDEFSQDDSLLSSEEDYIFTVKYR